MAKQRHIHAEGIQREEVDTEGLAAVLLLMAKRQAREKQRLAPLSEEDARHQASQARVDLDTPRNTSEPPIGD